MSYILMIGYKFRFIVFLLNAFFLNGCFKSFNLQAQLTSTPPVSLKIKKSLVQESKLPKSESSEAYKVKERELADNITVTVLKEKIPYKYRYVEDRVNFLSSVQQFKGVSKEWLVLVNFHGNSDVNYYKEFDPERDKDKRSLSWGTPFIWGAKYLKTIGDIHKYLALPLSWSGHKARGNVSIILIPKESHVKFMIGYAGSQQTFIKGTEVQDSREGYGMQIRWKYLPAGSIILTVPFNQFALHDRSSKRAVVAGKESKKIDLRNLLQQVLERYVPDEEDEDPLTSEVIKRILELNDNILNELGDSAIDPEEFMVETYGFQVVE